MPLFVLYGCANGHEKQSRRLFFFFFFSLHHDGSLRIAYVLFESYHFLLQIQLVICDSAKDPFVMFFINFRKSVCSSRSFSFLSVTDYVLLFFSFLLHLFLLFTQFVHSHFFAFSLLRVEIRFGLLCCFGMDWNRMNGQAMSGLEEKKKVTEQQR